MNNNKPELTEMQHCINNTLNRNIDLWFLFGAATYIQIILRARVGTKVYEMRSIANHDSS